MRAAPASFVLALTIACASSRTTADAQCLQWTAFQGSAPQIDGEVHTMLVHDDGTGSALYVAGNLVAPGGSARIGIRRWNGSIFSDVGTGIDGVVEALATFDDGSGPELYAGGTFAGDDLVRWDGAAWQPVPGFSGSVYALAVFDDGSGPALYVGGSLAGASGIVRWRFNAWSSLGTGVVLTQTQPGVVKALTVGDDGSGPALYVGGSFVQAGPYAALNVARWSAGVWSSVGPATFGAPVEELAALDDGGGPAIFCGGSFYMGGVAQGVARWNGSAWIGIRPGSSSLSLAVLDDGAGPRLYRTENYCSPSAVERWNGAVWAPVGPAIQQCSGSGQVRALATFDEASGPALFLGGNDQSIGPIHCSFARRDGTEWVRVGPPLEGLDATVRDLQVHDDGTGGVLIAAGDFRFADDRPAEGIAAWNGTGWNSLGFPSGQAPLFALASYDTGLGNELYAGGESCRLFRRRGTVWEFVGGSTLDAYDQIRALAVLDFGTGPELFVAGTFSWFGGVPAANIVRWDGVTWRVLGAQVNGVIGAVRALQVFDDGTGPVLYVGGDFTSAGGMPATRVARWDGTAWSSTPLGLPPVNAFAVHDQGAGPRLFAGTSSPVPRVWRLDGAAWQSVGGNFSSDVLALASFDDGSSSALYAGGWFWGSSLQTLRGIARWSGTTWTSVGSGFASGTSWGTVAALAVLDAVPGAGPELAAGGSFTTVGAQPARNFTVWRGCAGPISTFCSGDGTVAPCPCANQGAPPRGCENSQATGGAALSATGASAPDSIVLHGSGTTSHAATLVFQGDLLQSAPTRFGDGLRCVGGQQLRLYTVAAVGGAFAVPGPGQPSISARAAALGDVLSFGSIRGYQAWYRDPAPSFCAAPGGDLWNLSNAVRIVW